MERCQVGQVKNREPLVLLSFCGRFEAQVRNVRIGAADDADDTSLTRDTNGVGLPHPGEMGTPSRVLHGKHFQRCTVYSNSRLNSTT